MDSKHKAYIGLGSNLGDRADHIDKALTLLAESKGVTVREVSSIIESAALSGAEQGDYLNTVAELDTFLSVEELYEIISGVESALGRKRGEKWAARTIDLDLLLFGDEVIDYPNLKIPHRQMHLRSFVLNGLCELNSRLKHPVFKVTVEELAQRLNGSSFVIDGERAQLVSVAGVIGVGKTTLIQKLSEQFDCKLLFESYDSNPFMPEVYAGRAELALDSQLYFLTSRLRQLKPEALEKGKIFFTDYVFAKELIYARRLLDARQLALYEEMHERVSLMVAEPVLVVYLVDSESNCLKRIHRRNRPYEQRIKLEFLEKLGDDYEKVFSGWKSSPVIRISKSQFDCNNDSDVQALVKQIESYIAK